MPEAYTVRYNPISNQYDVIKGDTLIESWRKSDDANAHCYDLNHQAKSTRAASFEDGEGKTKHA